MGVFAGSGLGDPDPRVHLIPCSVPRSLFREPALVGSVVISGWVHVLTCSSDVFVGLVCVSEPRSELADF